MWEDNPRWPAPVCPLCLRHSYPNLICQELLTGALGTKGNEFPASIPVATERSTGCFIACEFCMWIISFVLSASLCVHRQRRRDVGRDSEDHVLAVLGENLLPVPSVLSRPQADWRPEFAEALSCISAENRDRLIPSRPGA